MYTLIGTTAVYIAPQNIGFKVQTPAVHKSHGDITAPIAGTDVVDTINSQTREDRLS